MTGDTEMVKLTVKGQSFMLHQIRKMVGVCLHACIPALPGLAVE